MIEDKRLQIEYWLWGAVECNDRAESGGGERKSR
jgi:hypothetical protein